MSRKTELYAIIQNLEHLKRYLETAYQDNPRGLDEALDGARYLSDLEA